MKENTDKYLDDLAKKIIKEGLIESPSFSFTESVMSQVLNLNKNHAIVYKPLISKSVWFLILAAIIMIVIYTVYFGGQSEDVSWINRIDFGVLSNNRITHLFHFNFSKTFTYAVVFSAIMIGVQVVFLKNHFNQRFQH